MPHLSPAVELPKDQTEGTAPAVELLHQLPCRTLDNLNLTIVMGDTHMAEDFCRTFLPMRTDSTIWTRVRLSLESCLVRMNMWRIIADALRGVRNYFKNGALQNCFLQPSLKTNSRFSQNASKCLKSGVTTS